MERNGVPGSGVAPLKNQWSGPVGVQPAKEMGAQFKAETAPVALPSEHLEEEQKQKEMAEDDGDGVHDDRKFHVVEELFVPVQLAEKQVAHLQANMEALKQKHLDAVKKMRERYTEASAKQTAAHRDVLNQVKEKAKESIRGLKAKLKDREAEVAAAEARVKETAAALENVTSKSMKQDKERRSSVGALAKALQANSAQLKELMESKEDVISKRFESIITRVAGAEAKLKKSQTALEAKIESLEKEREALKQQLNSASAAGVVGGDANASQAEVLQLRREKEALENELRASAQGSNAAGTTAVAAALSTGSGGGEEQKLRERVQELEAAKARMKEAYDEYLVGLADQLGMSEEEIRTKSAEVAQMEPSAAGAVAGASAKGGSSSDSADLAQARADLSRLEFQRDALRAELEKARQAAPARSEEDEKKIRDMEENIAAMEDRVAGMEAENKALKAALGAGAALDVEETSAPAAAGVDGADQKAADDAQEKVQAFMQQMEEQESKRSEEKKEADEKLQALSEEAAANKQKLQEAHDRAQVLKEQAKTLKADYAAMTKEEKAVAKEQLKTLKDDYAAAKSDYDAAKEADKNSAASLAEQKSLVDGLEQQHTAAVEDDRAKLAELKTEAEAISSGSGSVPAESAAAPAGTGKARVVYLPNAEDKAQISKLQRDLNRSQEEHTKSVNKMEQELESMKRQLEQAKLESKTSSSVASASALVAASSGDGTAVDPEVLANLEKAAAHERELTEQVEALTAELNELKEDKASVDAKVERLEKALAAASAGGEATGSGATSAEVEELTAQVEEKTKKYQETKEKAKKILEKYNALKDENAALKKAAEKAVSKDDVTEMKKAVGEKDKLIAKLTKDLEKSQKDAGKSTDKLEKQLRAEFEQKQKEADRDAKLKVKELEADLGKQLTEAKKNSEKFEKEYNKKKEELDVKTATLADLEAKYNKLVKQEAENAKTMEKLREESAAGVEAAAKLVEADAACQAAQKAQAIAEKQFFEANVHLKKTRNELEDLKGKIRVYCRCRPFNSREKELATPQCAKFPDQFTIQLLHEEKSGAQQKLVTTTKDFVFDHVFDYSTNGTQEHVFEETRGLAASTMDGYNVCIFAYGQTGSGKTYTMGGAPDAPGLKPRFVKEMFSIAEKNSKQYIYKFEVYLVEIYMDKLIDLFWKLENPGKKVDDAPELKIGKDSHGIIRIKNVVLKSFDNGNDLLDYVERAEANRKVGKTDMNAGSSRSHLIFAIMVNRTDPIKKKTYNGKISLVDLAGSESQAKTNATGVRLKEAQSINRSLSALANVIRALAERDQGGKEEHIRYRDNVLTRIMEDSLGHNAKTLMFVNISPSASEYDETKGSLTYASIVKTITNNATAQMETKEIQRLKGIIKKLKAGQNVDEDAEDGSEEDEKDEKDEKEAQQ